MKLFENSLVRGALAGAIATVPMTLTMTRLFDSLPRGQKSVPLPPGQITAEVERRMGLDLERHEHEALTSVNHFAYGAACGALYSLLFSRWKSSPVVKGPAFGFAVWVLSYLGWLPAAKILPPATRQPKERNALMIASHLIWGVSLARLAEKNARELIETAATGIAARGISAKMISRALA